MKKLTVLLFMTALVCTGYVATAAASSTESTGAATATKGEFFKKKNRIKGSWEIVESGGQTILRLSDKFKTKNAPDLKVFLSPHSASEANSDNALQDAVLLGVLKSNKGAQEYVIPAEIDTAEYSTILIHCEAYSVLWGGASL